MRRGDVRQATRGAITSRFIALGVRPANVKLVSPIFRGQRPAT